MTDDAQEDHPRQRLFSAAGMQPSPSLPQALSPVDQRLLARSAEIIEDDPKDVLYQHTVLCQTYFPYRDPKGLRQWERRTGRTSLLVEAGKIIDPVTMEFRDVGLPFGAKARLIVAHLNRRALQAGSNIIPIEENSFTAFVQSMQDPLRDKVTAPNGRELNAYKEQLTRFSVARLTFAMSVDERRAIQTSPQIIERLEVVWQRDERQRVLWPDTITLTPAYWESLQKHAVPLDARALAALAHSALAIDIYQWLAQRLVLRGVLLGLCELQNVARAPRDDVLPPALDEVATFRVGARQGVSDRPRQTRLFRDEEAHCSQLAGARVRAPFVSPWSLEERAAWSSGAAPASRPFPCGL